MPEITLTPVDYSNPQQAADLVALMDAYANDPMGGGKALSADVKQRLPKELAQRPHAFSVLCYVDEQPAALINCFEAFSTFRARPLVNIHDVIVASPFRGLGLSHRLLRAVEDIARQRGCCKLTLEVLEGNTVAQHSYRNFGFSGYELDPAMGRAIFWQKELD
tara:strand:- start:89593 stop:90081 length:489 start_codon:yes stop_codon:yes gene_type:complete